MEGKRMQFRVERKSDGRIVYTSGPAPIHLGSLSSTVPDSEFDAEALQMAVEDGAVAKGDEHLFKVVWFQTAT
jgi:hypothetical protein